MIVFDLQCSKGHTFEEWFKSSDEYAELTAKGELACPTCGDTTVTKGLQAPNVKGSTPDPEPAPASCGTGGGGCAGGMCPFG